MPYGIRWKFILNTLLRLATILVVMCHAGSAQNKVVGGYANVNGTKLYYETSGEGRPLLLIHGGLLNSREWDDQFTAFAKHYKVIRYDMRGYGKSDTPRKFFFHVDDVYNLLKHLKIKKTYVIGESFGAAVAIELALTHPEMVDALITVGGVVGGFPFSEQFLTRNEMNRKPLDEDGNVIKVVENWLADPYLIPPPQDSTYRVKFKEILMENLNVFAIPHYLARWLDPPAIRRLSEIQIPTLIVVGEMDIPDVHANADTIQAGIANSTRVVIPKAGHIVNMEKPEEFNRIVLDFLRKH